MDRYEALEALERIVKQQERGSRDLEGQHGIADDTLCRLLVSLDYKEIVDEYEKIDKWYA